MSGICDPDLLRERLAELVESFNAETGPQQRVELYNEMRILREQIAAIEASPVAP